MDKISGIISGNMIKMLSTMINLLHQATTTPGQPSTNKESDTTADLLNPVDSVELSKYAKDKNFSSLSDTYVGEAGTMKKPKPMYGHAIDINNNGKYDKGKDGVLVFDLNKDGIVTKNEVNKSNDMFKNGQIKKYDLNHDGKLSKKELKKAGARIWVDKNKDGKLGQNEINYADSDSWQLKNIKLTD